MAAALLTRGSAVGSATFTYRHLDPVLFAVALALGVARPEAAQPSRPQWLPVALVPVSAAVARLLIDPTSVDPSLAGAMAAAGRQSGGNPMTARAMTPTGDSDGLAHRQAMARDCDDHCRG